MVSRLYLDPSINVAGWAWFIDGNLRAADAIVTRKDKWERLAELTFKVPCQSYDEIIIEEPGAWTSGKRKSTPTDLIRLGASMGALVAGASPSIDVSIPSISPQKWKGNLPKDVVHVQMWDILSSKEATNMENLGVYTKRQRENAYDAICMGLYYEGRATWKKR